MHILGRSDTTSLNFGTIDLFKNITLEYSGNRLDFIAILLEACIRKYFRDTGRAQ